MSIDIMSWVWKHSPTKGIERMTLLSLADNANDQGYCWPGLNSIKQKVNCSRTRVISAIKNLEEGGYIQVVRPGEEGSMHNSNTYRIIIDPEKSIGSEKKPRRVKAYVETGTHGCTGGVNTGVLGGVHAGVPESSLEPKDNHNNSAQKTCAHVSSLDDLEEPQDQQPAKASTQRRKPRRSEKPIVGDIENLPPSHKPLAAAFVAGCARANIDAKAFLQTSGDLTLWRKSIGEWMQRKFTPDVIEQAVVKQAKMGWNIYGPQSITTCAKGVMAEAPAASSGAWHAGDPL